MFLARRWHRDRGLLYTAALGEGTFVRGISAGADDSRRVFVDHARKPCDTRVLESVEAGHTSHAVAAQVCNDLGITLPPIRVDGQCKYGLLSEGQVNRSENLVVYRTCGRESMGGGLALPCFGLYAWCDLAFSRGLARVACWVRGADCSRGPLSWCLPHALVFVVVVW